MDVLHLDCETHPVTQDDPAPPPICLQYCVSPEPEIRTGVASPFLPHGEGGLADRRAEIQKAAQASPASVEVGRLMVAGMDVYLKDERRPELSVRSETDGKVSICWEK